MRKFAKGIGCLILACVSVPAPAQYSLGTTGLLNAPSAEMQETGTFMIGGNFLPERMNPFDFNTGNYFAGITLFSFLELTYRETLLKTTYMTSRPKYNQQDRSMSVRLRPVREGRLMPAIVIGTNDPFRSLGNNYYRSIYGAATKHLLFGGHELGITVGYQGWTSDRNTLRDGVFGGITYSPAFCRQLRVIAEYDTEDINVGVTARLWNHLSLYALTNGFESVAGGLRFECTLVH